jgi:hypothetical protein
MRLEISGDAFKQCFRQGHGIHLLSQIKPIIKGNAEKYNQNIKTAAPKGAAVFCFHNTKKRAECGKNIYGITKEQKQKIDEFVDLVDTLDELIKE